MLIISISSVFAQHGLYSPFTSGTYTSKWFLACFIAIIISGTLLALSYIIAQVLQSPHLTAGVKNEFSQWIISAIIIAVFLLLFPIIENLTLTTMQQFGAEYATEMSGGGGAYIEYAITRGPMGASLSYSQAVAVYVIDSTNNNIKKLADSIDLRIQQVSEQSAKTGICNFWGVGYSISFCGALGALQGPLSNNFNAVNIAIAELDLLRLLIIAGGNIGLMIFLPVGILLRTFSFTRKTGGVLMALGIAFGLILPLGVVFLRFMVDQYYQEFGNVQYQIPYFYSGEKSCDEFNTRYGSDMQKPIQTYTDEGTLVVVTEPFILDSVVLTLGSLFFTLTFITSTAAMFGMPVDVSGLMRLLQ